MNIIINKDNIELNIFTFKLFTIKIPLKIK